MENANRLQVKSKQRVEKYGEVFTSPREVNAMLDLVLTETERIDSRFLEPACGDGNFLVEILKRKLNIVAKYYKRKFLDYEKNSILALGSIYGVDIQQDNCLSCRNRLFDIWNKAYIENCTKNVNEDTLRSARYILGKNIVCGNALSMRCVNEKGEDTAEPIIFSEWTFVTGSQLQRSDFRFDKLLEVSNQKHNPDGQAELFPTQEEEPRKAEFLYKKIAHYRRIWQNDK